MFDRELCIAEELDAYVEACQVGQRTECLADLPVDEWCLADKLLRLSAIARPDVQFLAKLEIQIFEAARKSVETIVQKNNKRTYSSPLYLSPVRMQNQAVIVSNSVGTIAEGNPQKGELLLMSGMVNADIVLGEELL